MNLCFSSEDWGNNGACILAEKVCTICMSISVTCHRISIQHLQYSLSIEFLGAHNVWEFHKTQRELKIPIYITTMTEQAEHASPKISHFLLEPKFSSNADRWKWHSKKHEQHGSYSILSYLCYFPVLAQHLHSKWWHWRKGKDRASFSFSYSCQGSFARMCAYQDVKYK